jgi:hypothetical protein
MPIPFTLDKETSSNIAEQPVLDGQIFSATTGSVSNAGNAVYAGLSIFNPANSGVSILLYLAEFYDNSTNGSHELRLTTSDPALATSITPINHKIGSPASKANCTFLNTGASGPGTVVDTFSCADMGVHEFVTPRTAILLPASASGNGVLIRPFFFANQTHFFGITAYYWERS